MNEGVEDSSDDTDNDNKNFFWDINFFYFSTSIAIEEVVILLHFVFVVVLESRSPLALLYLSSPISHSSRPTKLNVLLI